MEVKVIEAKNNEIRLVEDILLIYVKDINLLRNMNKEQLVEFMFNENEIVKSLSFVREFKESIRNCVFDIISVNELRDLIESKEVPLYSLIISTATYYKKIYLALKRNAIDEVSIECSKENFVNVISLVNNETRNVTIKCHDISLKEYSELLKDINVSNKNVKVDYQEANTPIKLNTLHNLSLFIGNIVSDINKYNLSNLEKIMYVYDIVKYRIYNKDEDNYLNNRDLDKVTSGNTIVCSGFSNLFNAILMSLDIKAMPLISKTANHQRSIVYVNDSKYDIDGIYVFDPTWDCRKKESENYYLERYNYFMMPLSRSKITAYDEISRLLEVNVKDIIKKIESQKHSTVYLISFIFFKVLISLILVVSLSIPTPLGVISLSKLLIFLDIISLTSSSTIKRPKSFSIGEVSLSYSSLLILSSLDTTVLIRSYKSISLTAALLNSILLTRYNNLKKIVLDNSF